MLTCPKCFEQFSKSRDLDKHLQRKVPCDAAENKCPSCAHSFSSKKGLNAHLDNNRCKGKSQALIAHEATLELQLLPQPQELLFCDSETSAELQAGQCRLDPVNRTIVQKDEFAPVVLDTASSNVNTVRPLGNVPVMNHPGFIEFGTKKIRKTYESPQQISVYDLILAVTNVKSNAAAAKAFLRIQEKPTTKLFRFPGGTRQTPVADIPACKKIAIQVLAGARMSLKQKNSILKALGMAEAILIRTYIEEETLEPIIRVFNSLSPVKQFSCGPFLIDLYFPNQKVALESY